MNANDVLIDILEDNRRRLHRLLNTLPEECLSWKPEEDANSIAVTIWHMARIFDVFLTLQTQGCPPDEENWFRHGWAEQIGYDPRSLGLNGWGMLTGYTQAEVAAIPPLTRKLIVGYLNDVYDSVKEFLENTPIENLQMPGAGFDGKYTKYQCIQMPLLDNVRHLGELFAIKASWDRTRR